MFWSIFKPKDVLHICKWTENHHQRKLCRSCDDFQTWENNNLLYSGGWVAEKFGSVCTSWSGIISKKFFVAHVVLECIWSCHVIYHQNLWILVVVTKAKLKEQSGWLFGKCFFFSIYFHPRFWKHFGKVRMNIILIFKCLFHKLRHKCRVHQNSMTQFL